MAEKKSLVYGVGLNDADYAVKPVVDGKRVCCPFYRAWTGILMRCYCEKYKKRQPTYNGCSVCDEWLTFSNFKKWMERQDWHDKEIDKDLLVIGNKVYSPDACAFVSSMTNSFIIDCGAARGEFPVGVSLNKSIGRIRARCCNPFTGKTEHLGHFECPSQAHQAWRKRKHELACQLAGLQTDSRVAAALRARYK